MQVDVHGIITSLFNVELNPFIAKYSPKIRSFETVRSEGWMEIRVLEENIFTAYVYYLKEFRSDLYSKTIDFKLPLDRFLSEIDSLTKFYVDAFIQNSYSNNIEVKQYILDPMLRFFVNLDKQLVTNYFEDKIDHLLKDVPQITIRIESFGFPVPNEKVRVAKILDPKFGNYSKENLISILLTDEFGTIGIKPLRGHYAIYIDKYKERRVESFISDKSVLIKVFDSNYLLKKLNKIIANIGKGVGKSNEVKKEL